MEHRAWLSDETLAQLSVELNALGKLFFYDPQQDAHEAYPLFETFATVDAPSLAAEWVGLDAEERKKAAAAFALFGDAVEDGRVKDEVAWEYRRLFVGPHKMPCPPYGSAYTDRERVIFGVTCLELRTWMRAHGIEGIEDNLPEDHIGKVMMLAAWLCLERPDLLGEFLERHVLPWSGHYLNYLEENACVGCYRGLAQIARLTLDALERELELTPRDLLLYW